MKDNLLKKHFVHFLPLFHPNSVFKCMLFYTKIRFKCHFVCKCYKGYKNIVLKIWVGTLANGFTSCNIFLERNIFREKNKDENQNICELKYTFNTNTMDTIFFIFRSDLISQGNPYLRVGDKSSNLQTPVQEQQHLLPNKHSSE